MFCFFVFFRAPPLPWEGVKNGHFWPDSFFFSRGRMQGDAREKKKGFQPEKRSRLKNIYRLRHRTPLRGRTNITIQTYGTEEVSPETLIKRIPFLYTLHKQVTHGHQRQAVVACCTSNRSFRKPAVVQQHTSR